MNAHRARTDASDFIREPIPGFMASLEIFFSVCAAERHADWVSRDVPRPLGMISWNTRRPKDGSKGSSSGSIHDLRET